MQVPRIHNFPGFTFSNFLFPQNELHLYSYYHRTLLRQGGVRLLIFDSDACSGACSAPQDPLDGFNGSLFITGTKKVEAEGCVQESEWNHSKQSEKGGEREDCECLPQFWHLTLSLHIMIDKDQIPLGSSHHVSTRSTCRVHVDKLDTAKMHGLNTSNAVSQLSSSCRACRAVLFEKLDTAKMHGLDTSNSSSRDVTSQVEFGLMYHLVMMSIARWDVWEPCVQHLQPWSLQWVRRQQCIGAQLQCRANVSSRQLAVMGQAASSQTRNTLQPITQLSTIQNWHYCKKTTRSLGTTSYKWQWVNVWPHSADKRIQRSTLQLGLQVGCQVALTDCIKPKV